MMNLLWGECTWEHLAQAAREDYLVILPAGAIEQHGPMLPVDVDARLAERGARDGAQRARDKYGLQVLVLPTLSYGQSAIHMQFPGTISFRVETYLAALYDILRAVVDFGFRSVVAYNGNGGNSAVLLAAGKKLMEELTRERRDAKVYIHLGWEERNFQEELAKIRASGLWPEGEQLGIHAASVETSEMLVDRPHLVVREKMVKPTLKRQQEPAFVWRTDEITDTGAFGDPSLATPEFGEALWEAVAEGLARYLAAISAERGSGRPR